MESWDEILRPTRETIVDLRKFYGDKTINQIRAEQGVAPVNGGNVGYCDWLSQFVIAPTELKVIPKNTVEVNQIVQLDPEKTTNPMFRGCLMVVTDVYEWGVQGYVQSLGENGTHGGQAYYRAQEGTFLPVEDNRAPWVLA